MIMKVGGPEDFPRPDDDFPVCGATMRNLRTEPCSVSESANVLYNVVSLYLAVCLAFWLP